ncbi:hypothetical protein, partial [Hydrocoleum sp. CS-953]|uniref:hypothetical protein n=1 Tax=Hydrocoleum sp. CS-953 TaxID=1671698 RepID=UPI001AF01051
KAGEKIFSSANLIIKNIPGEDFLSQNLKAIRKIFHNQLIKDQGCSFFRIEIKYHILNLKRSTSS